METMLLQNCWEFKGCVKMDCPARFEKKLNGIHGGVNAGRACWVVAGTRCGKGGEPQGTYAHKHHDCMQCEFYLKVRKEEFTRKDGHFVYGPTLVEMVSGAAV